MLSSGRYVLLLVITLCSLSLRAGEFSKGLLWKLEHNDSAASYLFGTMHSDDPSVVSLPAAVQTAFDQAQAVTLEIVLDEETLLSMATALLLDEGQTLQSIVGPGLYKRAVRVMETQGVPEMLLSRMKPWAVAVTLMTPPSDNGRVLDLELYQQAVRQGKPVHGLETVDEQLGLFDSLSQQDQIALLEDTLDHLQDIDKMLLQLREAYLQRDLDRLVALNQVSMKDSDPRLVETINRMVVLERNHRMADRLEPHLRQGGQFIAVGALHLPGEEGLLNLLKQRGYAVTRVY
jgi:uncharacterized protein YbaP (TraB family)